MAPTEGAPIGGWRGAHHGLEARLPATERARGWMYDFAPGTEWPEVDVHEGEERYYVISGEFIDRGRRLGPGSYVVFAPGSTHRPRTETGARMLGISTRRLTVVPPAADVEETGLDLSARIEDEVTELHALAGRDGVHTAALALDPRDWRFVRFVLWQDTVAPDDDATERYEVAHMSAPGLDVLPEGHRP